MCVCARAAVRAPSSEGRTTKIGKNLGLSFFLMFVFFVSCPCERSGLAGIGFQFAVSHGRLLFVLFDEFLANEREGRKRKRSVCFGLLVAHAVHTCTLALNHTQTSTRARKAGGTWTRARLSSVLFYVCVSLADVLCAPSGFPSHVARRCVIEVGGGVMPVHTSSPPLPLPPWDPCHLTAWRWGREC